MYSELLLKRSRNPLKFIRSDSTTTLAILDLWKVKLYFFHFLLKK